MQKRFYKTLEKFYYEFRPFVVLALGLRAITYYSASTTTLELVILFLGGVSVLYAYRVLVMRGKYRGLFGKAVQARFRTPKGPST